MKTTSDFVPENNWSKKCPHRMTPQFIVIHNTANDASAEKEVAYMKNNDSATSYHFAVDDANVRQAIPLDRNAWHAGDGNNGNGNRCGIAIEICYSKSGGERFLKAEENAAQLTAKLLMERGWGIDKVKKHQDFSGKYCPHRTLDMGWERFLKMVEKHMELTTVNDIVWELSARGIITDKEFWLKKLESDEKSYWLARKCVNYLRRETNGKN